MCLVGGDVERVKSCAVSTSYSASKLTSRVADSRYVIGDRGTAMQMFGRSLGIYQSAKYLIFQL